MIVHFFLSPLLSYLTIIATIKIIYRYWFVTIFFFFLLKKFPNISNCYVFNCFIFSFQSKQFSYIFNCNVIYIFLQSKMISYIFNYVILCLCFFNILSIKLFIIIHFEKVFSFFKKIFYVNFFC